MMVRTKEGHMGTYFTITLQSVHLCLRGHTGDAECTVPTACYHQSAVGGNRTRSQLQTLSASNQQRIKSKKDVRVLCAV